MDHPLRTQILSALGKGTLTELERALSLVHELAAQNEETGPISEDPAGSHDAKQIAQF
jgi:hypothetical protein